LTYYELLKELRRAYKGRAGAVTNYIVRDNSEIGYSMVSEYIDFRDTDKTMLSLRMITARQDFITFTRTSSGITWMNENIIQKMADMRLAEREQHDTTL
jgi:hypothetical protein